MERGREAHRGLRRELSSHDDEREATIATARKIRGANGAVSAVDLSRIMHEEFTRKFVRTTYGREPTPEELASLPSFYGDDADDVPARSSPRAAASSSEFHQNDRLVEHLLVLAFGTRWKAEVQQLAGLSSRRRIEQKGALMDQGDSI